MIKVSKSKGKENDFENFGKNHPSRKDNSQYRIAEFVVEIPSKFNGKIIYEIFN